MGLNNHLQEVQRCNGLKYEEKDSLIYGFRILDLLWMGQVSASNLYFHETLMHSIAKQL